MKSIEQICTENGLRLTKVRRALLELLQQQNRAWSAKELLQALAEQELSVNKTTVYRQLEDLVKCGVVDVLYYEVGVARYMMAESAGGEKSLSVCDDCYGLERFVDADLQQEIMELSSKLKQKGIALKYHLIKKDGCCGVCKE